MAKAKVRRTFTATVAASSTVGGVTLDLDRMDTKSYLRNPVVLWKHGKGDAAASLPVGKTLRLWRDGGVLKAEFEFLEGDAFAERVRNAWEKGHLGAASIGWVNDSQGAANGRARPRMLEWSIVSVPADAGAVRRESGPVMLPYPRLPRGVWEIPGSA